ncbi:E3 ubiquitin-protein ligase RBBP6-like isoform X4 [Vespula squamosa]|uniref:E3 ubiquitin-protein ligase RBBP6-like isoform X4 n=1 Tax=Vespula squamosa TaxID=30214 RepID=A0ABD1ZV79_VESSQ
MVLTVTEDTPADMLAGSMELLVQLPREHHLNAQRVTVQRSTPMMDLLVQIATAHKLAASSYTLQAIGERGSVLPHQPNTPIGALDALQVKLLPKQCTFVPKKTKPANQPFETTFRLQVHLPRNQLYVSRVSPKMNLGEILNEVCREKNLDKHKYELRHPVNLEEILDLSLSLQDYHLQEVTLYAKQGRTLGSALSSQDIMALQRQEERRRQQAKQSVFGFMFKKSKESSVSTDSLEGRSVSPARSDETGRSASPLQPPTRPQRKRRLAPKPPTSYDREQQRATGTTTGTMATTARAATAAAAGTTNGESSKEKMLIGHSRNSSDSSGYHEASVLSDNPDSAGRLPETLPRRNRTPGTNETPRKLVHTSQSSKSLGNLAVTASGTSLDRALSSSSLSSTGLKKKRAAPPPPVSRPLSSAISTQALERIDDSEESLTSDMDPSKPPSDIGAPSKASSDIGVSTIVLDKADHPGKTKKEKGSIRASNVNAVEDPPKVENARVEVKRGKVARSLDNTDDYLTHCSFATANSPEYVREAAGRSDENFGQDETRRRAKNEFSKPVDKDLCSTESKLEKSPSLTGCDEYRPEGESSADGSIGTKAVVDLDGIETDIEAMPECGILETRYSHAERFHVDNYICGERCRAKILKHSASFQNAARLKDTRIVNAYERKTRFAGSQSFRAWKEFDPKRDSSRKLSSSALYESAPRLGDVRTTKCYEDSIVSSHNDLGCPTGGRNNLSPLSNLQIFAISTKPLDIQVAPIESIPNDIDELPSLPIVQHSESKPEPEKKLSILEPPPPGLLLTNNQRLPPPPSHDSIPSTFLPSSVCFSLSFSLSFFFFSWRWCVPVEKASSEELAPLPKPRKDVQAKEEKLSPVAPPVPKRRLAPPVAISRSPRKDHLDPSSSANVIKTNARDAVRSSFSSSSSGGIEFEARDTDAESSEVDKRSNLLTKHARSMNDIYNVDSSLYKSCTVISTIPKCDRFEISRNSRSSSCGRLADDRVKDRRERSEERTYRTKDDYEGDFDDVSVTKDDEISGDSSNGSKRPKVYRSPSESNDFQIDSFNKRKRHLTSQSKDIAFALNLNLTFESQKETDVEKESGQTQRTNAVEGISDVERKLCDTDALLHKVSETLSSSSLASSNEETENACPAAKRSNGESRRAVAAAEEEEEEEEEEEPPLLLEERKNQQDTSDYVSALEEDSSMADWEYQLPAPPSAFRDTDSSLFDGYDTITLRSIEAFKESPVENRDDARKFDESFDFDRIEGKTTTTTTTTTTDKDKSKKMESRKTEVEAKFKKEVIPELETKIERGTLARSQKEPDSRKVFSGTSALTSKFAPVDNTLSNFTITTYTRQKSIDIFKEREDKSSLGDEPSRYKKTEPKISNDVVESTRVWQSPNAKAGIVKRSKSHASAMGKPKSSKNEADENSANVRSDVDDGDDDDTTAPRERVNDEFTRWRDNVFKRQEELTKGKELRSLQVLKSILPRLTSSQPAEENVSKERSAVTRERANTRFEGSSNQDSVTPSVLSSHGESHVTAQRENKQDSMQKETSAKRRYAYNGPPSISLGSWAERPTFKVQIKTDTDYKFQREKLADGATTIPSNASNRTKESNDKRDADDLASKSIADKAVSAFKRATFDKTVAPESKNEGRPIVTGVELKRTVAKEKEDVVKKSTKDGDKDDEKLIDTTPLNFQELTKAFRIDTEHRIKPQRSNANRHSDYYGSHQEFVRKTLDPKKQNGQAMPDEFSFRRNVFQKDNASINGNRNVTANSEGNQFGSIVGINSVDRRRRDQNGQRSDNVSMRNNANSAKAHPVPMPVVKGFNVTTTPFKESKGINVDKVNRSKEVVEALPPKPPTMPVIMGVTLKSANARPKSMPINIDSRDMLLESIRNFGGRGKLKNTAERY